MEQYYLFIHKLHEEVFTIRHDEINEKSFKNALHNNIRYIIKNKALNGGQFRIVNLSNAVEETFEIDNDLVGGADENIDNIQDPIMKGKELFGGEFAEFVNYIHFHLGSNLNVDTVKQYYNNLSRYAREIDVSKDELDELITKILSHTDFDSKTIVGGNNISGDNIVDFVMFGNYVENNDKKKVFGTTDKNNNTSIKDKINIQSSQKPINNLSIPPIDSEQHINISNNIDIIKTPNLSEIKKESNDLNALSLANVSSQKNVFWPSQ